MISYSQSLRGWLEQSWGSSRGLILDWTGSQQLDGDLDNLTGWLCVLLKCVLFCPTTFQAKFPDVVTPII